MPFVVLAFGLLVGGGLLLYALAGAPPRTVAGVLRTGSLIAATLVAVALAAVGRWSLALGLAAATLMLLRSARSGPARAQGPFAGGGTFQGAPDGAGPSGTGRSSVETGRLRMILDHASGEMEGEVLSGRFAGRRLADLTVDDIIELRREHSDDAQTAALLEAYLDRLVGPEWRDGQGPRGRSAAGASTMSRAAALSVLGLSGDPDPGEVRRAHREMMARVHPDVGGSEALAREVNAARDVLLGD